MPTIKQILATLGVAVGATIVAGVVAFLNEVHLELSFDKLKDFRITDLSSWTKLGTSLRLDLDRASAEDFVAYWGDIDGGKTIVRQSSIGYENFRNRNRIRGQITDVDDKQTYQLTGYYNDGRVVLTHRGPITGTGVYILDRMQIDSLSIVAYAGYTILEDQVTPGAAGVKLLQCPFVMVDETAAKKFPTLDAAKAAFPFLGKSCTPFEMPVDITVAITKP
jgi:hypothetical protein